MATHPIESPYYLTTFWPPIGMHKEIFMLNMKVKGLKYPKLS